MLQTANYGARRRAHAAVLRAEGGSHSVEARPECTSHRRRPATWTIRGDDEVTDGRGSMGGGEESWGAIKCVLTQLPLVTVANGLINWE